MPTNKRERVYIYASMTPADQEAWDEIGLEPGDLPTGVIVGTVEVVGCRKVRGELRMGPGEAGQTKASTQTKESSSAGVVLSILREPLQRQGTDLIGPFPSFRSDPNQE
jgi:hypothetical protein